MTTNPFSSPNPLDASEPFGPGSIEYARQKVAAPAIALMVVAGLCMGLTGLGFLFDIFLLVSGMAQENDRGGVVNPILTVIVRMAWGVGLFVVSGIVLAGARQMKQAKNYTFARQVAILAMIPCAEPCCVLGIPFGAWAFSVLGDDAVKAGFR